MTDIFQLAQLDGGRRGDWVKIPQAEGHAVSEFNENSLCSRRLTIKISSKYDKLLVTYSIKQTELEFDFRIYSDFCSK